VDLKIGLTNKDNQIRIEAFGENRRIRKRPKSNLTKPSGKYFVMSLKI